MLQKEGHAPEDFFSYFIDIRLISQGEIKNLVACPSLFFAWSTGPSQKTSLDCSVFCGHGPESGGYSDMGYYWRRRSSWVPGAHCDHAGNLLAEHCGGRIGLYLGYRQLFVYPMNRQLSTSHDVVDSWILLGTKYLLEITRNVVDLTTANTDINTSFWKLIRPYTHYYMHKIILKKLKSG